MAAKKASPAMDFILKCLEQNNGASYKEVSEAAGNKGLVVYPVMYGRAKLKLGLASSGKAKASGGSGAAQKSKKANRKKAKSTAAKSTAAKPKQAKKPAEMTSPGKALAQAISSSGRRGPGRPRKAAKTAASKSAGSAASSIDGIVAAVKSSAEARARYQTALQRISSILEGVLDD
ncbi:MAG: hypothetical protein AB8H80_01590 [Planctomycetota bacterium]